MKNTIYFLGLCIVVFSAVSFAPGQRRVGRVCGDPTVKCKAEGFQPYDLAFDTGKSYVIIESEPFYGIVLRSTKMGEWGDCEKPLFKEPERLQVQQLFPRNKVFALNCVDTGTNYYTGVNSETAFIGVYAGRTLAEANAFLKKVKATNRFPGVRLRRMRIGINGT